MPTLFSSFIASFYNLLSVMLIILQSTVIVFEGLAYSVNCIDSNLGLHLPVLFFLRL